MRGEEEKGRGGSNKRIKGLGRKEGRGRLIEEKQVA